MKRIIIFLLFAIFSICLTGCHLSTLEIKNDKPEWHDEIAENDFYDTPVYSVPYFHNGGLYYLNDNEPFMYKDLYIESGIISETGETVIFHTLSNIGSISFEDLLPAIEENTDKTTVFPREDAVIVEIYRNK